MSYLVSIIQKLTSFTGKRRTWLEKTPYFYEIYLCQIPRRPIFLMRSDPLIGGRPFRTKEEEEEERLQTFPGRCPLFFFSVGLLQVNFPLFCSSPVALSLSRKYINFSLIFITFLIKHLPILFSNNRFFQRISLLQHSLCSNRFCCDNFFIWENV